MRPFQTERRCFAGEGPRPGLNILTINYVPQHGVICPFVLDLGRVEEVRGKVGMERLWHTLLINMTWGIKLHGQKGSQCCSWGITTRKMAKTRVTIDFWFFLNFLYFNYKIHRNIHLATYWRSFCITAYWYRTFQGFVESPTQFFDFFIFIFYYKLSENLFRKKRSSSIRRLIQEND